MEIYSWQNKIDTAYIMTVPAHDNPYLLFGISFLYPQWFYEGWTSKTNKQKKWSKLIFEVVLSPPGWITATHYSLEPLARAFKGSSMCRTVLLGSWLECASRNTLHPSSVHFTGFPSPPRLTPMSPSSLTSVPCAPLTHMVSTPKD